MTDKYAIVFPGQGSQSVGMMAELFSNNTVVRETFEEASDVLDFNLWSLISEGPAEQLNQTHNTQPAMLCSGIAIWRVMQQAGLKAEPSIMAGHSLGEYSALVASEAISFADAVALVAERGRLMQQAVPEGQGAMAAILGLEDSKVVEICTASADGQVVQAVNFNAPGQVVIAGDKTAVERAMLAAKQEGAKRALPLPVSVPSHCMLMKPAADSLAVRLADIRISTPVIRVLHNVNVEAASQPAEISELLTQQLYSPVRWVETIEKMYQEGTGLIVEAGPGKVLTGLSKRINKAISGMAVYDQATLDTLMEKINA